MLDELGKRTTDVIGTVRKDRKALPKDVNAKLNKGETKTAYSPQYNAMRMQWKDKWDVLMLSSCIPGESVSVVRRGKEVTVPLVINIYNNMMGGVDLSDQMMNSYPVERKRLKAWYKKMWIHLVNSCVFNAHILYKKKGGKLTSLEFRTRLVSQIVEKYGEDTENYRRGGRPSTDDNPFRSVKRRFPYYIPPTEKKINATKRCVVCRKRGVRKESYYECVRCNAALYAALCFEIYHKVKVF